MAHHQNRHVCLAVHIYGSFENQKPVPRPFLPRVRPAHRKNGARPPGCCVGCAARGEDTHTHTFRTMPQARRGCSTLLPSRRCQPTQWRLWPTAGGTGSRPGCGGLATHPLDTHNGGGLATHPLVRAGTGEPGLRIKRCCVAAAASSLLARASRQPSQISRTAAQEIFRTTVRQSRLAPGHRGCSTLLQHHPRPMQRCL